MRLRQLALGGIAVAVTYGVGALIGAQAHRALRAGATGRSIKGI